jgi:lipopolysaccharide/colanic/teichoic acid biosynthesis glycosyltransferase
LEHLLTLSSIQLFSQAAQLQKRAIDLLVSALGMLFLCPFFALAALAIRLEAPGPILYRQPRLGRGGNIFEMLKFRTMLVGAETLLQEKMLNDPALRAEYAEFQKFKHDPRITRAGRLMRRLSIDELPQLWNVFRGEMSLVGPRPLMLTQGELYASAMPDYVRVVPGITGLWQISGRNLIPFQTRIEFDQQYFHAWSLWLDFRILARTIGVVLRGEGAG